MVPSINLGVSGYNFQEIYCIFRLKILFTLITNSVDPDEVLYYATFHLGLQCLPKYPFRGFQFTKG